MGNLLSFFLGACAAMLYARHRRRLQLKREGGYQLRSDSDSNWAATYSCQVNLSSGSLTPSSSSETPSSLATANTDSSATTSANTLASFHPTTLRDNSDSGALPRAATAPALPSSDSWAAERERVREIGNQFGVNVMEFSEQTLDTLLSTIENLKANVVQRRQAREKQD